MIVLKERLKEVLSPAEMCLLAEALNQLSMMRLEADARWRVLQVEHALASKETQRSLEEP